MAAEFVECLPPLLILDLYLCVHMGGEYNLAC